MCAMTIWAKDEIVVTSGEFSCMKEKGKKAIVMIDWSDTKIVKYDPKEENVEEYLGSFEEYVDSQADDALVNMAIKPKLQEEHYGRKEWLNIKIKQSNAKMKKEEPIAVWEPSKEDIKAVRMAYYRTLNSSEYNYKNKNAMHFMAQRDSAKIIMPLGYYNEMEKMKDLYDNLSNAEYDYLFTIKIDTLDVGSGAASSAASAAVGRMAGKAGGAILRGTLICQDAKTHEIIATAELDRVKGFGASYDVDRVQSVLITLIGDIKSKIK